MSYKNVAVDLGQYPVNSIKNGIIHGNKTNSNRVSEGKNREDFNNNYAQISKGKSNAYDITYETSSYKSTLLYRKDGNKSLYNYGYEGSESSRDPFNGIDEQYMIKANTKNAYQSNNTEGYLDSIKTKEEIRKSGIEEITDINLGLEKREKVDLTLVKDLESVKVNINQAEHVYKYADRFNSTLYYDENGKNGYDMEPAVKFGQKYGNMSYTRALYASDVHYTGEDKLEVRTTYRIGVKNVSSQLTAVVNEMIDYYDNKYELVAVGKQINEDGSIKEESKVEAKEEKSENELYEKIRIKTDLEVESLQEGYIYVELRVKPDKIIDILGNDNKEIKLDNVTEISSYSIKDKDGKYYAAIDVDSQPESADINEENNGGTKETYEDDTDKAPGLKLVLQESRKVSGKIFEDKTEEGQLKGEIRQGTGAYEEGEKTIANVEVKLIDQKTGKVAQVWDGEKWVEAVTKTDEKGEFTLEGYIPEVYKIEYTWGDKQYKVQEYKSTIVDKESYEDKSKEENIQWYKDEFKKKYPNVEWDTSKNKEIRTSDAVDRYEEREKIDAQTKLITNANKKVLENYEGEIELPDGTKQKLITQMTSETPTFRINVEYETEATTARDEYETNADGTIKMNGLYAVKKAGKENYIRSIDFGITQRAKQALELTKKVRGAKITLSDGNVVANAQISREGTLQEGAKNVMYIPESEGAKSQVRFEIDSEIVEGAQLEIEYGLQVENISELDYLNKDFYLYGKGHGENQKDLVRLDAKNVVDYLDNGVSSNITESDTEKILQTMNEKQELINKGYLDNSEQMKQLLNRTTRVLNTSKLSEKLAPITTQDSNTAIEISLKESKLLANISTNEVLIENNAEIINVEKTGGSNLETTPGSYIPNVTISEYDNDEAESVTIVPPTGKNLNYVAYTLLAISSLGILLSGIILIKKYVLKR